MTKYNVFLVAPLLSVLSGSAHAWATDSNLRSRPCAGMPKNFQLFEGACLPDRLIGYIKCVAALGGNRLRVITEMNSGSTSDTRIDVEGKGEGVIVKGAGRGAFSRKSLDQHIRKLDTVYGDQATTQCLVAAGIRNPGAAAKPQSKEAAGASGNTVNVTSINQAGGITANNVVFAAPQRSLSDPNALPLRKQMLEVLAKNKPIAVTAVLGDIESYRFAAEIHSFLKSNGFKMQEDGISQGVFMPPPRGVSVNKDSDPIQIVVGSAN